jgi:DNA-binding transcriptional regulator YiaG
MNKKTDEGLLRYKGCGLDNVYLRNGYRWAVIGGEQTLIVEDMQGLHRTIALFIVDSPLPLDAKTFRFLRKELDMSQRQLASVFGVDEQSVSLWERARTPIPQSADLILRALTMETCSGNAELKRLIERGNSLDRDLRDLEARIELKHAKRWERVASREPRSAASG